jgi:hypothetical protein
MYSRAGNSRAGKCQAGDDAGETHVDQDFEAWIELFEVVCHGYLQAAGLTIQYIRPSTVILEV